MLKEIIISEDVLEKLVADDEAKGHCPETGEDITIKVED